MTPTQNPRVPAIPLHVIVRVAGLPDVVIDPADFDDVLIDELEHLIAATAVTVDQTIRDLVADNAELFPALLPKGSQP